MPVTPGAEPFTHNGDGRLPVLATREKLDTV